jgi:hypothetical protein
MRHELLAQAAGAGRNHRIMSDPDPLNPHKMFLIRLAIQNAMAADQIAQRLKEAYVKYIILANAGGIVACLGIEGALVGSKANDAPPIPFSAVSWPMRLFLLGLICGGLVVTLERARAIDASEQQGREALRIMRDTGSIVPTVESTFSAIERKSLPHIILAINILGIISQVSFFIGSIWGLARISGAH